MLHDGTRPQGLACMATLAFIGLLVLEPIVFLTITMTTGYANLVSLFFEFFSTGFLVGVIYSKIRDIHSVIYLIVTDVSIMNINELNKYI